MFQEYIRAQTAALNITSTTYRVRKKKEIAPRKRKLDETEFGGLEENEECREITEMFAPFVRGHYQVSTLTIFFPVVRSRTSLSLIHI